ncbi:MAG: hypothetical protein NVS4B10_17550 [Myxococcales bacterium]
MLALILALALAASPSGDPAAQTDATAPAAAPAPAPTDAPAKAQRKSKRKSKKKGKKTKVSSKKGKKSRKSIAKDLRDAEIGRAWLAAHGVPPNLPTVTATAQPEAAPEPMPAMKQATSEALAEAKQPAVAAAPARFTASISPVPNVGRAPRDSLSVGYTPAEGSIYKLSPAADTALIAAGVIGTVLPYAYASRLVTPTGAGNPGSLNALDQKALGHKFDPTYAWASNITAAASVGLPVLLDLADLGPSSALVEDAVVMTEVMAITGALATAAKYGLQRRTPLLYGGQAAGYAGDVEQYKSFYSAQTAVTFAALSATAFTLSERYDQRVWPWLVTAAVGGSVAAERVATGRAFYTDVIAGAVAGVAVGTLVPWLHLRTGVSGMVVPTDRGVTISGGKSF